MHTPTFIVVNKGSRYLTLADLLNDFSTGAFDCNDQFLVECCRKHGLCMLTNDWDFTEGGITVYTANNRLLTACPP